MRIIFEQEQIKIQSDKKTWFVFTWPQFSSFLVAYKIIIHLTKDAS